MGLDKNETSSKDTQSEPSNGAAGGHETSGASNGIASKPEIVFDEALGKELDGKKLVRYQLNPRENWGPMNRARGH